MNKKIVIAVFLSLTISTFAMPVDARSGCCSHHDGVCGCRCCDGTALSATCAPYYPACQQKTETVTKPITDTTGTEKFKLLSDVKNMLATYQKNPNGYREKLIAQLVTSHPNLELDFIGFAVYKYLPDVIK